MILHQRRFVILSVIAALVTGTAIASRRETWSAPADRIAANQLLENAQHATQPSAVVPGTQSVLSPQDSIEASKTPRRQFTVYRNEAGEVVCREATPEEISARQQ